MMQDSDIRTYSRREAIVFRKTVEVYGGLSNMAAGYPLLVNGVRILTSEALYQACRFPHRPDVQRLIIGQASPMAAKMIGKPYRGDTREDWDVIRVNIMRWCLRVKLAQNWERFGELLRSTGELPIVEESVKDAFWGAKPIDDDTLRGMNVLGRLLMEVRAKLLDDSSDELLSVAPLHVPDFLLLGRPIDTISGYAALSAFPQGRNEEMGQSVIQMTFDQLTNPDASAETSSHDVPLGRTEPASEE